METVVASRTSASSDVESQEACATLSVMLAVPHMMCGGCVRTIEQALLATPGVGAARANLGARRVFVTFTSPDTSTGELIGVLKNEGFSSAELADDDPSQSAR